MHALARSALKLVVDTQIIIPIREGHPRIASRREVVITITNSPQAGSEFKIKAECYTFVRERKGGLFQAFKKQKKTSSLSNTGEPSPAGTFLTTHSTTPPTESPFFRRAERGNGQIIWQNVTRMHVLHRSLRAEWQMK